MAENRDARRALMALASWDCRKCGRALDTARGGWACARCGTPHCPWCGARASHRCRHLLAAMDTIARMHLGRGGVTLTNLPRPDPAARPPTGWSEGQIAAAFGDLAPLVAVNRGDLLSLLDSPEVFDGVCRRIPELVDVVAPPIDPRHTDYNPFRLRRHAYFAADAEEAWVQIARVYADLGARLGVLVRMAPLSAPLFQAALPGGGESSVSTRGDVVVAVQRRGPAEQVHVLRPATGELLAIGPHDDGERSVSSVFLSADGDRLVLRWGSGYQGWDTVAGERRWHLRLVGERGWPSLDAGFTRLACRMRDGVVMLDPRDGRVLWRPRQGRPAGRRTVEVEGRPVTVGEVGAVRSPSSGQSTWWDAHYFSGTRPAVSPDGAEVCLTSAVTVQNRTAVVVTWWDGADGHLLHLDTAHTVLSSGMPLPSPVYAPDGQTLLTTSGAPDSPHLVGGEVTVWDARTHQPVTVLIHDATVRDAVYSPDGRRVATVAGRAVYLWETATGGLLRRWELPAATRQLGVSVDGAGVVVAMDDGAVRVLSHTGEVGPSLRHLRRGGLAMSAGGRVFATIEGRAVTIRDARSGDPVATLDHLAWVWDARLSGDGRTVATYSTDRVTRVWRLPIG